MVVLVAKSCIYALLRCNPAGSDDGQVSGINGDVRRALELLRLALDVYRDDQDKSKTSQVMVGHVANFEPINPQTLLN